MSSMAKRLIIPNSNFIYRLWTITLAFIALFSVHVTPIYLAFLSKSWLSALDVVMNVIFFMDWILQFWVAQEDNTTHAQIARNYLLRNHGSLDFVSLIPVQALLWPSSNIVYITVIYITFIIVRLWRLRRLRVWISWFEKKSPECFELIRLIKLIWVILLNMHVWGCIYYRIASIDLDEGMSWTSGNKDFFKQPFKTKYVTSTYFAMTIYSTVGFGDYHACSVAEMIICMINMITNMGLNACVLEQFLELVNKRRRRMNKSDAPASEGKTKGDGSVHDIEAGIQEHLQCTAGSPDNDYEPKEEKKNCFGSRVPTSLCDYLGAGIKNINNSCFMSVVLQALTHTPPLYRGLHNLEHTCPFSTEGYDDFCILCALQNHFRKALDPSRRIVEPLELLSSLHTFMSSYTEGVHQDPHEFLLCVLDKLKESLPPQDNLIDQILNKLKESLPPQDNLIDQILNELKESLPPQDNLIDQIFGSTLVTKLRCLTCNRSSARASERDINYLSLDITDTNDIKLALAKNFTAEKVVRECLVCKQNKTTEKQDVFGKVPLVAIVQLQRFDNNGNKITKHVRFSKDLVLLSHDFDAGGDETRWKYDLYAIVQHRGDLLRQGHCVVYIRSDSDQWYLMNDTQVTLVLEAEALTTEAYILFYLQKGKLPAPTKLTTKQTEDKTAALKTREDMDKMERQKKSEKHVEVQPQGKKKKNRKTNKG